MPQFASDNNAGMCPSAIDALVAANGSGHVSGYGDDSWTKRACDLLRDLFETTGQVFFVFNGTAANALCLAQMTKPYNSVIAHAFSHIEMDEAGAPGFFSGGAKLMLADTPQAKLTPEAVARLATKHRSMHHVKAAALSITQSTELGTVYTVDEIRALTRVAREHALKVHMDGTRLANAIARIGCTPAEITWKSGIDILCFGGVKNGLGVGEAIVVFDNELAHEFEWRIKQAGQLNSKMRLVTAPWTGILENGVWLANAHHANAMADRLAGALAQVAGVRIMEHVEANAVFAEIPVTVQAALRDRGWKFYTFLGATGCRLMCAWDTTPDVIDRFAADLAAATLEV
jgi:threonine aldolase